MTNGIRAYHRALPGGGFVAIDVHAIRTPFWRPRRYEGEIVVERRSAWRDGDHPSPVIARAADSSVEAVVQRLLPTALRNEAIAAALLRLNPAPCATQAPVCMPEV
jgi:hypothetical protein